MTSGRGNFNAETGVAVDFRFACRRVLWQHVAKESSNTTAVKRDHKRSLFRRRDAQSGWLSRSRQSQVIGRWTT